MVSDSYDIWNACEKVWGEELHDLVVERGERGGTLVVRPDSGDPPEVVVKVSRHNRSKILQSMVLTQSNILDRNRKS